MTSISFSSCCVTLVYFRFMASPITFLQPPLFFAVAFHFRICSKSTASVQASSHLLLGSPTGHLLPKYRPIIFLELRYLMCIFLDINTPVKIWYKIYTIQSYTTLYFIKLDYNSSDMFRPNLCCRLQADL